MLARWVQSQGGTQQLDGVSVTAANNHQTPPRCLRCPGCFSHLEPVEVTGATNLQAKSASAHRRSDILWAAGDQIGKGPSQVTRASLFAGQGQNSPSHTTPVRTRLAWPALAVILALYVFSALRVDPITNFGNMEDALYFLASAKALASGQGYILPSLPIRLSAAKYPELYPLLLAGIWRIDPHFPSNILPAALLTTVLGCFALVFAFLLLRRLPRLNDWESLAIVALCAFTGYFLDLSASVLSDAPFMAAMLAAIWLAERAVSKSEGGRWAALGAGALAASSMGFRTVGVSVIAGIGLSLLLRREYGKLLWFCAAAAPLSQVFLWPSLRANRHPGGFPLQVGSHVSGWMQTLCYYSNQGCNWRMDIAGPGALKAVILTNIKTVIQQPGLFLLHPLATRDALWSLALVTVISIAAYAGIVRLLRQSPWHAFPLTFLLYLPVVIPYPTTPGRYLVPFLPLMFAGLWLEGRKVVQLASHNLKSSSSPAERTVGGAFLLAIAALCLTVLVNLAYSVPAKISSIAEGNSALLEAERGAFEWIRAHTAPDARIIAYRDGLTYLYTGRTSLLPIMCLTQSFYLKDSGFAEHDAQRLPDVARYFKASYWLVSPLDFNLTGDVDMPVLQSGQQRLLAKAPLVYQSPDGIVRLYDLRCFTGAHAASCAGVSPDEWPAAKTEN